MSRYYISADYANEDGDRNVVEKLHSWSGPNYLDFTDLAQVVSGSVSKKDDCRSCELKKEFNNQINASSVVIFIVGDKTRNREAGSVCGKAAGLGFPCCTPYKQNSNGSKACNNYSYNDYFYNNYYSIDVNPINNYSYLRHEFEQAKKKKKKIIIFYNSTQYQNSWLPYYMRGYEDNAYPFWDYGSYGWITNYNRIKRVIENA